MVQAEASGKTCFDIGEAQPIDAERAGWGEYDIIKELQFRNFHTTPTPPILGGELITP
jgi:hypothetical protein